MSDSPRLRIIAVAALLAFPTAWSAPRAVADTRIFRPLTADPRENQTRWRMMSFTEDWRYGADVTDSTSTGGWEEDRADIGWEVSGGATAHWRPLQRLAGWRGPWIRYQLGATGGMFADFDATGSLLVTDYRFGARLDMLWTGAWDDARGITGFDAPVVTSRLGVFHRSAHLGDEYLTLSDFGRNREGLDRLFQNPPVKRVEFSYEALEAVVSVEWAPPPLDDATVRVYAGGELKAKLPSRWELGGIKPRGFDTPAARLGLEFRGAGNRPDPPEGAVGRLLNRVLRAPFVTSEWFAAVDLRLAKPFNFAGCDNPDGCDEVWTPRMSSDCLYGRPFAHYAGSWHAMVGTMLSRRGRDAEAGLSGPEWLVALEWYRGYSPNGQFLDQKLRYRPRWYVIPSVTAHF